MILLAPLLSSVWIPATTSIDGWIVSSCSVRHPLTTARIKEVVASFYQIPVGHMENQSRQRSIARPRQVAMYFSRTLARKPLPEIGRRFNRDHSTVIHAVHQVERLIATDCDFAADVEALREALS